jgi:hypothetical protein
MLSELLLYLKWAGRLQVRPALADRLAHLRQCCAQFEQLLG